MPKPIRYAHVQNPEPSLDFYAEVKDLVKRIDPEHGDVVWWFGKGTQGGSGSWYVRMAGRESLFPFDGGCEFDSLYTGNEERLTKDNHLVRDLREDAVYLLVELMRSEKFAYVGEGPPTLR